jgi:hypothetical protein
MPTFVQQNGVGVTGTSTAAVPFLSHVSKNNAVLVAIGQNTASGGTFTVTDTLGTPLVQIGPQWEWSPSAMLVLYAGFAPADGPDEVTVQSSSSADLTVVVLEYEFIPLPPLTTMAECLDSTENNVGIVGPGDGITITFFTAISPDLLISLAYDSTNSQSWTPSSGWTQEANQGNSDGETLAVADQEADSMFSPYPCTWTSVNGSGGFVGANYGFSFSTNPPPPPPPPPCTGPGILAQVNAPFSNRVQLVLECWVGPLVRPTSPPVPFDPTDPKVLEVYINGIPATVKTASFDSVNNRYLLFLAEAFDPSTAVVQAIHHMPSPPYQYGLPVVA